MEDTATIEQEVQQEQEPKFKVKDFAAKIKIKYPAYSGMDDKELVDKFLIKYPVYKDKVDFGETEKKNEIEPTPQKEGIGSSKYVTPLGTGLSSTPKVEPIDKKEGSSYIDVDGNKITIKNGQEITSNATSDDWKILPKETLEQYKASKNYTPKVEKFEGALPDGQLPPIKNTLEKYGIKAPVIPKEQDINQSVSTEAVQPKVTASYDDFVAHNEERTIKKKELRKQAVDNAAMKVLKNKGVIKPEEEGKALNISQFAQLNTEKQRLQEALDNGDATFVISKNGELGLSKTIGFWDALTKGWNQATKANDEAAEFFDMDAAQKVDFLHQKQAEQETKEPSEYLGERPSSVGSIGQLAGENAPFIGKAIAASAAGSAMVMAAPETLGASLTGLPAAMAFAFTANDSKNQGVMAEVTRRFNQLKQENPEADEVELMKQAEEGALVGGMAGILTNAALMSSVKTPLSNVAKGVVGKSITKAVGNAVYGGASVAGIEGAKMAEGNLEGIKATPTEIAKHMGTSFSETASTLGILHVMTGVLTGALRVPNIVKSAFKYALKDAKPTEIQNTLKANVESGAITPEVAEKVVADLDQYKAAVAKTPNGLSPEAEASVAGLIQAKDKLIAEMKTKDDTAKPFYEEKIAGINEQIQKTVNTGKPYAHEIDEISGEKYTEQKEQPQPEVIEPSTEIKSEVKEPSQEQQLQDVKDGNLVTFTYKSDAEVPDVFKDKISSSGETNGETIIRVTIPKSLADYHLSTEQAKSQPSTVKREEVGVIKNDKGEPTTFYHGSANEFGEFDMTKLGSHTGAKSANEGVFFSTSKNVANSYKQQQVYDNPNLSGVEKGLNSLGKEEIAKIGQKVLGNDAQAYYGDMSKKEAIEDIMDAIKNDQLERHYPDRSKHIEKVAAELKDVKPYLEKGQIVESKISLKNPKIVDAKEEHAEDIGLEEIIKTAKKEGHDGVIIKNVYDQISFERNDSELSDIAVVFDKKSILKSENKPIQQNEEVSPEIKKLETERDNKIKELEKVEVPKLEYVKEDDLVKMKNETELIEEQRGIKKREAQLRKLIECLTK